MKPEIDLLVDFVNTRDVEEQTDSIAEPAQLVEWIAERTVERLPELEPADEGERDARAVFTERLGVEQELYAAGLVDS